VKINDYLTSGEVAELLGVTKATVANWTRKKKIKTYVHPINGFKLYRLIDINNIIKKLTNSGK
jgi:excisionase family DNA binding protein